MKKTHKNDIIALKERKWEKEPAEARFFHNQVFCLIRRQPTELYLEAFVQVPANHPYLTQKPVLSQLHGGIKHQGSLPGEDGCWLGIAANEDQDIRPHAYSQSSMFWTYAYGELPIYRDFEFMTQQIKYLAENL